MTAFVASLDAVIPVAVQWIAAPGLGCAGDLASDAVAAFAAMATTPSLNWQSQVIARRFLAAFAGLDEWQRAPLSARLAARVDVRGFAAWWAITARHRVDPAYAVPSRACWGTHLAGALVPLPSWVAGKRKPALKPTGPHVSTTPPTE